MAQRLTKGDKVEWETSQGTTSGKVVKRVTKPTKVKGHRAEASPDDPQYLVESEKSGEQAVHRPDALKKR